MIVKILRLKLWSHNKIWKQTAASGITTSNLFTVARRHVSLSVQFLGCSTIPLEARASKRYGPSSWKLLQPLLRTMRCFSQSLQMQEERFYMDISSGGGPQGNCQQVDAWICKIAFLSSLWGHCVWGPIQFLQGVLLKTTWQSSFPGAFSATSATIWHTPPSSTFLLRRKPRLRILLKRLAEAPDPLAFLLWYLVKTFVNWQQLLISRTKDLNPSMSESEKPDTEANESRSLRISAQRKGMLDCAYTCLHSSADFTGVRPNSSKKWFIMQDASIVVGRGEQCFWPFDPWSIMNESTKGP